MHISGPQATSRRSRELRKTMSKPERLLWWALKGDKLGARFRRSHPAGPYILDFYCAAANLCVEVDGPQHELTAEHDAARDGYLEKLGVRTLRIPADEVLRNLEGVVHHIADALTPPPSALRAATSPKFPGEELRTQLLREIEAPVSEAD